MVRYEMISSDKLLNISDVFFITICLGKLK